MASLEATSNLALVSLQTSWTISTRSLNFIRIDPNTTDISNQIFATVHNKHGDTPVEESKLNDGARSMWILSKCWEAIHLFRKRSHSNWYIPSRQCAPPKWSTLFLRCSISLPGRPWMPQRPRNFSTEVHYPKKSKRRMLWRDGLCGTWDTDSTRIKKSVPRSNQLNCKSPLVRSKQVGENQRATDENSYIVAIEIFNTIPNDLKDLPGKLWDRCFNRK